jgi:hypothetical protein
MLLCAFTFNYTETVRSCSNKVGLCREREKSSRPAEVKSTTRLFADDCFLYRKVKSDCTLQQDLDTIQKSENQCLMRFNLDKCEVLQITRTTTLQYKYTIQGRVLNKVNSAKNLGLNIHKTFHWDNNINKKTQKAHNTFSFSSRNLSRWKSDVTTPACS